MAKKDLVGISTEMWINVAPSTSPLVSFISPLPPIVLPLSCPPSLSLQSLHLGSLILHAFARFMLVVLFLRVLEIDVDNEEFVNYLGILVGARLRCWSNTNEPVSLSTLHSS